jgi:hypothetical protein
VSSLREKGGDDGSDVPVATGDEDAHWGRTLDACSGERAVAERR